MELKNFVDFAYSMVNMEEVQNGSFSLPKEMVFNLNKNDHIRVHKKIKTEKGDQNLENLEQDFEVAIFDINFKFVCG